MSVDSSPSPYPVLSQPLSRKWFVAPLLYAIAVALFFGPVLTGQQALWGHDWNYLFHPYLAMAQERLRAGHLALWTPEIGLGYPLFSEGQALQLYPPAVLLLWILPSWWAAGWLIASHVWLGAMGGYSLARRRALPQSSALLVGFTYGFSGFFTLRYMHPTVIVVGALLPFLICAVDNALTPSPEQAGRTRGIARWIAAGGVLALMLLGGHHQFTLYGLGLAVAYILFRLLPVSRRAEPVLRGRVVGIGFVLCLVCGFAVACLPLMATREMTPFLLRRGLNATEFALGFGFPTQNLLLLLLPHLWGDGATYMGESLFWEVCPYLTALPWLFALGGWVVAPRNRNLWFWTAIALLTLPIAITDGNPLQALLIKIPGWTNFRVPSRVFVVTSLSGAMLLGHGHALLMQALPQAQARARRVLGYLAVASVLLLLMGIFIFTGGQNGLLALASGHAFAVPVKTRADAMYNSLGGADGLFLLLDLTVGIVALTALARAKGGNTEGARGRFAATSLQRGATLVLALLLMGDFWRVSAGFQQRIAPSYWSYTAPPVKFLQEHETSTQPFRIWMAQQAQYSDTESNVPRYTKLPVPFDNKWLLLPGQNTYAHIPNVQALVGLELLRQHNMAKPTLLDQGNSFLSATDEDARKPLVIHSVDDETRARLLGLMDTRYVLSTQPQEWDKNLWKLVWHDGVYIYENQQALPRAWMVGAARQVAATDEYREMVDPSFEPRRQALIEGDTRPLSATVPPNFKGTADITSYTDTRVTVQTHSNAPGLLMLADSWYPDWHAQVDDHEVPILRADYALRGVVLPPGNHTVIYTYSPQWWTPSLIVSILATLLVLTSLVVLWLPRGRASHNDTNAPTT